MLVDERIRELTIMLAYLTSWKETPDSSRRAWKGYDFAVLDVLEEQGLIYGSHRAKSFWWTEEGEESARQLLAKYGFTQE